MTGKVQLIDSGKLVPNDIIRADIETKTFDYNIDILKSSIEVQGVLTPLLVSQSDGRYLIVDGNRRFVAGIKAGLKEFPCIVVDEYQADNFAKITEVGFSANELRQDLTPSQEVEALKRVCEKGNLTLEQIAESTGKTVDQLRKISARKGLHQKIIDLVDAGKVSKTATNHLTALSHDEQVEVVDTFQALEVPVTDRNIRLYRGQKPKSNAREVSLKVVKKLQENIGLHAEELDKLKKYYKRLSVELDLAHRLAQRIWKISELHDYIKANHSKIYKDFGKVLKVLGF